jgi:hypothetical protein
MILGGVKLLNLVSVVCNYDDDDNDDDDIVVVATDSCDYMKKDYG